MSAGYFGFLLGAFAIQVVVGYLVGGLIGIRRRRNAAFVGALIASLFAAYLVRGPTPNDEYGPLMVWVLTAVFFWWRIGREPNTAINKPS